MPAGNLTGSRIRERRLSLGLRQSVLAQTAGISASYLNLIEHNRRRIGGKLLVRLAGALDIDAAQLAEGAEAALLGELNDAASAEAASPAETDRTEEFAGQYPGWADLVLAQKRRIAALEHSVETLSDRLAHDPHLAASLHDLLSTVTAVRSTASILVETRDIAGEWRDRFHRNLFEDSARLADGTEALVRYLDAGSETQRAPGSPQDEFEVWLQAGGYHVPGLERALPASAATLLRDAEGLESREARSLAERYLERYREDAIRMPLAEFVRLIEAEGFDPARIAERFGADLAAVLRRAATLPEDSGIGPYGLVRCDGSGTLTFRKPVEGFALPRLGAACPLWPLYQALGRPMAPVRALVEVAGRDPARFLAYAVAAPVTPLRFDAPPVVEATMLILPAGPGQVPEGPVQPIGSSCRVCPRAACAARREPSVLPLAG